MSAEELQAIKARRASAEGEDVLHAGRVLADIDTLLAEVERLTSENDNAKAALIAAAQLMREANERAEALSLELDHLRPEWAQMRAERDAANVSCAAALRDAANMRQERDALASRTVLADIIAQRDAANMWRDKIAAERDAARVELAQARAQLAGVDDEHGRLLREEESRAQAVERIWDDHRHM